MSNLICGNSLEELKKFPDNFFDSSNSDPPYEISMMSKKWDSSGIAFNVDLWKEVSRVLKPGAYLTAFGASRSYHRLACAVEDAGFEICDSLAWFYSQGFPKSKNMERAVAKLTCKLPGRHFEGKTPTGKKAKEGDHTCPQNEESVKYLGIGSALKPCIEPIVLARKPLSGTYGQNILEFGTGGLNIDACRVEHASPEDLAKHIAGVEAIKARGGSMEGSWKNSSDLSQANDVSTAGRWPGNVILDETIAEMLNERYGIHKAGRSVTRNGGGGKIFGGKNAGPRPDSGYTDAGGISRYFYCPKTSKKERDAGLDSWPTLSGGEMTDREDGTAGVANPRAGAGRLGGRKNPHITVKPMDLIRWLLRLTTPVGGKTLDHFMGSGTTGCAAAFEDVEFYGIDLDPLHVRLAGDRIAYWSKQAEKGKEKTLFDMVG